jgi:hypothetical protein
MALPQDLLTVAADLATIDPFRPRQAALRRALSTAYYALFRLLVDAAAAQMFHAALDRERFTGAAARTFTHAALRRAAEGAMRGGTARPEPARAILGAGQPSPDLYRVCKAFIDAQARREAADYDIAARFDRSDVLASLQEVQNAFAAWDRLRQTDEGARFLALLVLAPRARQG